MQLPQELTLEVAEAALQALNAAPSGGGSFDIDASALQAFDSAALALLLAARRLAQSRGQALRVHAAPPKLVQLAQLYGVAGLLDLQTAG